MTPARIWWRHARMALPLFVCALTVAATTKVDPWVAQRFFFDASTRRWLGGGQWWANTLLHEGGRWLIRIVVIAAILIAARAFYGDRWSSCRRPALYFILAMALTVGIVGALKATTNVDCPWDLVPFHGPYPYVALFADRPDALPAAKCFPAAHAGTGYALVALYFALLERSRRWALRGLSAGLAVGIIFGLGQQARGAHFVSHDIVSLSVAWLMSLTLYTWGFRARLWPLEK